MRVIAGSRRHLILKTVPGMAVRPTQDRTKETLFNIINPYLADCRFLDLFSGSGAIGIEALSRGAGDVVMVEQSAESLACIKENLKTTKRNSYILPEFNGKIIYVYNGLIYKKVKITENMVGTKFGQYVLTRKVCKHKVKKVQKN